MECIVFGFLLFLPLLHADTHPNDARILHDFASGLDNPDILKWPPGGTDPCGPPPWPHVFCSHDGRVTQIQVQGLGLSGPLPPDLNQLDRLQNVGLQRNRFTGDLPTFSGLSDLQFAYLDFNDFDSIPADFFAGLTGVRVLALDSNPFNRTSGWTLPLDLANCGQLVNFSCSGCNIAGALPEFLGSLPSLSSLHLAYNRLTGTIPASFRGSMLQTLWLNDQDGDGLSGPIDAIADMPGLTQVWLHGNTFSGTIPDEIGHLTSLRDLNLNRNRLVGTIPISLAEMELQRLDLSNNMLMGAVPKLKAKNASYESNTFCVTIPGEECAPEVTALLEFLHGLNYPARLASEWVGNDPCSGPWWGITCNSKPQVTVVNLQKMMLNGTLSDSLVDLPALIQLHLEGNNLHGPVPSNLTRLSSLRLLNLSGNDFDPPLPKFRDNVEVVTNGNLKFQRIGLNPDHRAPKPPQAPNPDRAPEPPQAPNPDRAPEPIGAIGSRPNSPSPGDNQKSPSGNLSNWPREDKSPHVVTEQPQTPANSKRSKVLFIAAAGGGVVVLALLIVILVLYCLRQRSMKKSPPSSIVIHPRDSSDPSNIVKITSTSASPLEAQNLSGSTNVIESGNLLISLQVLRKVTNNFAQENEIGRGGFGVVYKGELDDGSKIAVKRMVVGTISNKALDEFQSEIAVLSKVRHRNLVSLLGYAVEGTERLLVYEYMPQGALSRHLFRPGSEPLSWTRRLNIALDVARGVEYLHSLAHQSFIHRDLKSANILLDDNFRAKVSDFGLVKLAPDRERSVATRLAGTFGYLAPEYAVTGKITTKVDVFSFGVVLMELLTGLVALDDQRDEANRYLAEWFWQIMLNRETLMAAIDPSLDAKEEDYETIQTIAVLAGHCTARDPNHRPEMGHAVNVLGRLVEKWNPHEETDDFSGIDLTLPLPQMLKGWQEESGRRDISGSGSQDSKGSIPAKPSGFADSFTSADAR